MKKIFTGYFDLLEAERKQLKENKMNYEKYSGPKSGSLKENLANELLFDREQAKAIEEFKRKKEKETEPDLHKLVFGEYNPYFKGNEALTEEQQIQLIKSAYNAPKSTITELRQDFQTFTKGFGAMALTAGIAGQPHIQAGATAAAGVSTGITTGIALYEMGYDHIHAYIDKSIHELNNFINKLNGAKTTSKSLKEIQEYNKEVSKQEEELKKLITKLEKDRIKLEKANKTSNKETKETISYDVGIEVINAIEEFKDTTKKYISFEKPLPPLFDESYNEVYITNIPVDAVNKPITTKPEQETKGGNRPPRDKKTRKPKIHNEVKTVPELKGVKEERESR